jgi:hypothetical protein
LSSTITVGNFYVIGSIVGSGTINAAAASFYPLSILTIAYLANTSSFNTYPQGGYLNWIGDLDLTGGMFLSFQSKFFHQFFSFPLFFHPFFISLLFVYFINIDKPINNIYPLSS